MASDNLRQIGRYMRQTNRQADLALKRYANKIPKRERARDTVSSVFPMQFIVHSEGKSGDTFTIDINFNKPPPEDCSADCIGTACEDFEMFTSAQLITLTNPYEPGTVRVYNRGEAVDASQWVEENPSGGEVYVQPVGDNEIMVICYSYITC